MKTFFSLFNKFDIDKKLLLYFLYFQNKEKLFIGSIKITDANKNVSTLAS
jgi:hypothetical protein